MVCRGPTVTQPCYYIFNIRMFAKILVGFGFLHTISSQHVTAIPPHEKIIAVEKSDQSDVFNLRIIGLGNSVGWLANGATYDSPV